MAPRRRSASDGMPVTILEALAQQAVHVAKKARKHRQNLAGDTFYGNRLAEIRADAVNAFRDLSSQSVGDTTALAELIETVFSTTTVASERLESARELAFALRTTWKQPRSVKSSKDDEGLFPLAILVQAERDYLVTVGRQMNGCFAQGWYDACAVMMRRLIEIAIIEAFEHKGIANKIKGHGGNYLHLSNLVALAVDEPTLTLSRNARKVLPQLREIGHMSAHGRYYHARKEDVERVQPGCRVVVEELLHHAGLL